MDTAKKAGGNLSADLRQTLAVVFLGPFMTQMDATVVNVSLSTIRDSLHATINATQWVVSGYLLALALTLPLNAWLVDRVGAKRLYLGCFSAFTMASMLCGAATTMPQLIAARLIQGVAGGLLAPMTAMMIARVAGTQMARAMGYTTAPVLLAPLAGPVVAGAVLKYAGWPWLFYINVPVGIVAVISAALLLPADGHKTQRRRFDLLGFAMLSPGLACALYGFEETAHQRGGGFLLLGTVLLAAFVVHAMRHEGTALLDLSLFRNRIFSAATRTQFFANGVIYAGGFLVPLYLTTACNLSASEAGWLLAAAGIGMLCSYPTMGYFTEHFGCRAVSAVGASLSLLGTVPLLWMTHSGFSPAVALFALLVRGIGQGATGIPSSSAAYASVPRDRLAVGTTTINIVQRLGGPVATTALGIVMSLSATHLPAVGAHSFTVPFVALMFLQVILLGSASRLPVEIYQPTTT